MLALGGSAATATATPASRRRPARPRPVELPERRPATSKAAAKAAGCKLDAPRERGRRRTRSKDFTAADYKTNPPTSGTHFPTGTEDGIYAPGDAPKLGKLVHTLEHGRINVQYKPGTPEATSTSSRRFVAENDGYHMLLFENTDRHGARRSPRPRGTTRSTCPKIERPGRATRCGPSATRYIDKGPEKVP